MEITIRNEVPDDHRAVEALTKQAFWNVHAPGCDEHYLAHMLRKHDDFIPELDFVLLADGAVIGNIMYTKAKLIDGDGREKAILTFGPLSVLPAYQRRGYGKRLVEHSFVKAAELGYNAVVIFGNPANYVGLGFKSCKKYGVSLDGDIFPTALLVKELKPGSLGGRTWRYQESSAYHIDAEAAAKFDEGFEALEKKETPSQEEFYILSRSRIQ